jgi:transposase
VLQVDGYDGFKRLALDRPDSSVTLAFCWAHMRRGFYDFWVSTKSPLAAWVLARIGELYAIETEIRGQPAEHRRHVRQERSRPIVEALHTWMQEHVGRVSAVSDLAKAIRYAIRHWPGVVRFLDDGRVEMDTNVVERAIRPNTLTRKNALFAGNDGAARSLGNRDDTDPDSEAERRQFRWPTWPTYWNASSRDKRSGMNCTRCCHGTG